MNLLVAYSLGVLAVYWFARRVYMFRKATIRLNHPGHRALFPSTTLVGHLIPGRIEGVNHTIGWMWRTKRHYYEKHGTSILSICSFLTSNGRGVFVASTPLTTTSLNTLRRTFSKPVRVYKILTLYGQNLVTTEGAEWRRHRKVAAPGFNEGVFELVWKTMEQVMWDCWQDEGLVDMKEGEVVEVKKVHEITLKLALAVLSTASFGAPLSYNPRPTIDPAHTKEGEQGMEISFTQAISDVSENIIWLLLAPKWFLSLPHPFLRKVSLADRSLRHYMYSMIATRRAQLKRGEEPRRKDLFGELIAGSLGDEAGEKDEEGKKGMTDEELVGNTFIFTLAGHETSAHTLAFTYAFLALNPSVQSWLFEELQSVFPDGHTPSYKDYPKLERTLAVLYETLRLCPPVVLIPKQAVEDTWIEDDSLEDVYAGKEIPEEVRAKWPDVEGKRRIFVRAGTSVNIDVVGLHRHPKYWPDPEAFKPERFLEPYELGAFIPFSAGPRGCVGRRFAEVESVLAIALICRHFEIFPRPLKPGETEAKRAEVLMAAKEGLTLTPKGVDLVFKRRGGEGLRRAEWDGE